jgi:hypothetical protein
MNCKLILLPLLLERVGERRIKSHLISPSSQPSPSREKEPVFNLDIHALKDKNYVRAIERKKTIIR